MVDLSIAMFAMEFTGFYRDPPAGTPIPMVASHTVLGVSMGFLNYGLHIITIYYNIYIRIYIYTNIIYITIYYNIYIYNNII